MKTEDKKEIYTLHKLTVSMYEAWQLHEPHGPEIYYAGANIFDQMLEKSMSDEKYAQRYLDWLRQKTSTIELRDLCRDIGYDYWQDLVTSNAINFIDSARLWWCNKQHDLIRERFDNY